MTASTKRHLHPAVVHLLLACFCAVCFAVVAVNISGNKPITEFDALYAPRIHEYAVKHAEVWNSAVFITDLGSRWPRTAVVAAAVIVLLLHRQWRLALLLAATQWLFGEVVGLAKDHFERPRPTFEDAPSSYPAGGWSFPSGHAGGVMATYGMIGFLIAWRWPGRWFTWLTIALICAIILAVGLTRMLLGVHWFSDILGGYLLGLTWVSLCVAVIEWQRAKNTMQ